MHKTIKNKKGIPPKPNGAAVTKFMNKFTNGASFPQVYEWGVFSTSLRKCATVYYFFKIVKCLHKN